MKSLGVWHSADSAKNISICVPASGGVAVLLQTQGYGVIICAASYVNN